MQEKKKKTVKNHIVSMRISAEEWETLREIMKYLKVDSVSDLMREAFRHVTASAPLFESASDESTSSDYFSEYAGQSGQL